jgi:hypothetical protein
MQKVIGFLNGTWSFRAAGGSELGILHVVADAPSQKCTCESNDSSSRISWHHENVNQESLNFWGCPNQVAWLVILNYLLFSQNVIYSESIICFKLFFGHFEIRFRFVSSPTILNRLCFDSGDDRLSYMLQCMKWMFSVSFAGIIAHCAKY